MAKFTENSRLCDILLAYPSLIPVVFRMGITMGVGELSVKQTCIRHGIDIDLFLCIINTFIFEDYSPSIDFNSSSIESIIEYLEKTSEHYKKIQLPNIERHFRLFREKSGANNNIDLLWHFFEDMKEAFIEAINFDQRSLFPLMKASETLKSDNGEKTFSCIYTDLEERLQDLLTFLVVHLQGNYDSNLGMAVITAVFELRRDVCQNNKLRRRLLLPLIENR